MRGGGSVTSAIVGTWLRRLLALLWAKKIEEGGGINWMPWN